MILTIVPNPSLDKTAIIPHFELGKIFRPPSVLGLPGGKGLNFARALRNLDGDPLVVGPFGGYTGQAILSHAATEGIRCDPMPIPGETRTCLSIVDPATGQITELYELGPEFGADDWDIFIEHISKHFSSAERLVLSGSCFPGTPETGLYDLTQAARAAGLEVFLDTYGQRLHHALAAQPTLVKCNQAEASDLLQQNIASPAAAFAAASEIQRRGASAVVITLGKHGAIGVDQRGIKFGWEAPNTGSIFTTGSGDSLFAGIVAGLSQYQTLAEAVCLGVAAGAANTLQPGAGIFEASQVMELLEQTKAMEQP